MLVDLRSVTLSLKKNSTYLLATHLAENKIWETLPVIYIPSFKYINTINGDHYMFKKLTLNSLNDKFALPHIP
jgi:hypothetical protein